MPKMMRLNPSRRQALHSSRLRNSGFNLDRGLPSREARSKCCSIRAPALGSVTAQAEVVGCAAPQCSCLAGRALAGALPMKLQFPGQRPAGGPTTLGACLAGDRLAAASTSRRGAGRGCGRKGKASSVRVSPAPLPALPAPTSGVRKLAADGELV